MKQEEKSRLSRERILDAATKEFAARGYGGAAVNTICEEGNISKGILYHHFADKDDLYLGCLARMFSALAQEMDRTMQDVPSDPAAALSLYFSRRSSYFVAHPLDSRLFLEAVTSPPGHLREEIGTIRQEWDAENRKVLEAILSRASLRTGLSAGDVIRFFSDFQNGINADPSFPREGKQREKALRAAVMILLFGAIEK